MRGKKRDRRQVEVKAEGQHKKELTAHEAEIIAKELRDHKKEMARIERIKSGNLTEQDKFEIACRESADNYGAGTSSRRIGRFGEKRW